MYFDHCLLLIGAPGIIGVTKVNAGLESLQGGKPWVHYTPRGTQIALVPSVLTDSLLEDGSPGNLGH